MEQLTAERLVGIDVLRGLAVLFVVFNHIPHYAMGGFRENPFFFPAMLMDYGYLGVPLFVLISGFCIHRRAAIAEMTEGAAKLNWIDFWKRRFWRLYPPYLVAMIVSVLASVLIYSKSPLVLETLCWDTATHLLMIHNLTADYAGGMANGAFWSLGMEEQLYLLYVPLFCLIRRGRRSAAILLAAATTTLWRALSPAACTIDQAAALPERFFGLGAWGLWPFSFWLHWALGAIAVDAYFGNCRLPKWCSSLTAAASFACVAAAMNRLFLQFLGETSLGPELLPLTSLAARFSNVSELIFAISFFCLLNWSVKSGPPHILLTNHAGLLLARLGRVSYSVYLIHIPVIFSLEVILPFQHSVSDWISRLSIYTTASLLVSFVFYSMVEKWFIHGQCPWAPKPHTSRIGPAQNRQDLSSSPAPRKL